MSYKLHISSFDLVSHLISALCTDTLSQGFSLIEFQIKLSSHVGCRPEEPRNENMKASHPSRKQIVRKKANKNKTKERDGNKYSNNWVYHINRSSLIPVCGPRLIRYNPLQPAYFSANPYRIIATRAILRYSSTSLLAENHPPRKEKRCLLRG